MKPSFALDFRDGVIALLHRTSRGWQQVGATPIDAGDLAEALAYLRSTALGLSPRGLATKLVIPNEHILYLTLHAPGPDAAKRRRQIKAALEGRTPYAVEELVFDWWGSGPEVQVAVVAKETLAEAEAFAAEHRLNPVSFVAAPENGTYLGEPFFGPTALSASLLAAGEKVERDADPIAVIARELPRAEPAPAAAAPEPLPAPEPEPATAPEPAPAAPEVVAEAPVAEAPVEAPTPAPAAVEAPVASEPAPLEEAPAETAPLVAEAEPTPAPAVTEAAPPPPAEPVTQAEEPAAPAEASPLPDFAAARRPPEGSAGFDPRKLAVDLVDEAPMAVDVASPDPAPEPGPDAPEAAGAGKDEIPPSPATTLLAALASRRAAAAEAPGATGTASRSIPADFAKAAGEARARKAPTVGPAPSQRPSVPRPTLARPAAATPGTAAPRDTLPFPARGPSAAKPAVKGRPAFGVGTIAAATAKGDKNVVPLPKPGAPAEGTAPTAKPARKATGLDGRPVPVRGKPRYLGLILTVILLLALAGVAAWSSFSVSNSDAPAGQSGEVAPDAAPADTAALPTPEDEALADGQDLAATDPAAAPAPDPTAAAEATAPAAETAATTTAEPAPETGVVTDAAQASDPGSAGQDEIFLASTDLPPQTSDPVLLPQPVAGSDPPPQLAAPPPPFGTVYAFDAEGRIQPTPEGIITPEGVLLVEGPPETVPPARPAALTAPAAAAPAPDAAATPGTETAPAGTTGEPAASETFEADPALQGKRPQARPEGLAAPEAPQQGEAASPAPGARFADIRPAPRPEALTVQPETPPAQEAAAASLAANGVALAVSRKPAARPSGMDQAVDAAVAAAIQSGEAQPPAEEQTASLAPEAQQEPEAEAPAPDLPTSASVARQATVKDALNLSKLSLIGIFGTASGRYAMVRQPNGAIKRVKVGDPIDGGRVAAISATELQYQKGGRMLTLTLPRG